MKKYQFHFSLVMLMLYMIQLFPNIIWVLFPSNYDILAQSNNISPIVDMLEHILGVASVISLIFLKRRNEKEGFNKKVLFLIAGITTLGYYASWGLYYRGVRDCILFFLMAFLPSVYFFMLAFWKRNWISLCIILCFGITHIGITWVNLIGG